MRHGLKILEGDVVDVAKRLLGCLLIRTINGQSLIVKIVETEAYHQTDAASHSYKGQTERTGVMFGPPGFCYVYFTYGMHYCMNVVTGRQGEGSAVLIRAAEPISGLESMQHNRRGITGNGLTNGPAKLCQALQINKSFNGHDLRNAPLRLELQPPLDPKIITQTTRIGITKDTHRLWRFYITDNLFISKK